MAIKKAAKKVAKKVIKKAAPKKAVKKVVKKAAPKKVVKKVVKKAAPKKVVKKVAPKKVAAPKKVGVVKKTFTNSEILKTVAEHAGITKAQAVQVFETLTEVVQGHIKTGGAGMLKLAGLMKIEKIHKPAKKARKGINPFTGEEMMFKAKPAHYVIKVRALKKLKEMI